MIVIGENEQKKTSSLTCLSFFFVNYFLFNHACTFFFFFRIETSSRPYILCLAACKRVVVVFSS